jgi:hypothetical protein
MLSARTLRFLHRQIDDFVVIHKARSGSLSVAELERLLRNSAADAQEMKEALADYRRYRNELQSREEA